MFANLTALIILFRWITHTDALANNSVKHSTPTSRMMERREELSTTVNCSEACSS
jgi:hypothetical protein